MAGGRKTDRLAEMAASEAIPAPDFAGADDAADADGRKPLLPEDCPVTPLGVNGLKLVFLDRLNQIQSAATKCDKGDLMLWFGNGWLEGHFPQYGKGKDAAGEPIQNGFDQREVQVALVEDCHDRGIFNPAGRVFGRGAHRGPNGGRELVLHMGGRVLVADPAQRNIKHRLRMVKPGAVSVAGEVLYYPALSNLPAPADNGAAREDAAMLLGALKRFYWVEEQGAPLLMLGMIAQMFVCGALGWRSHMWLVAPTSSGKSTLQAIIRELLGSWCLHTEDASEAAIRQVLGDDTLPVLIDEAEAHDKPERMAQLLNLMKKSSSGAKIHRGGADHKASEFTAQSCFLLSSVLHAPLRGEDRNRLAILELRKVPDDAPPLELEMAMWRTKGRAFHRRMIEQWPRWAETYGEYRRAIGAVGYGSRWQDTYGTLLACADLLLFDYGPREIVPSDEPGPERVSAAVASVLPLMERGRTEARSDVERVLLHLTSTMLPGAHGASGEPVGLWIDRAMAWVSGEYETDAPKPNEAARAKIKAHGLRVVTLTDKPGQKQPSVGDPTPDDWDGAYLAVAYSSNQPLCELFARSDWAGGAWVQSLGKIEGVRKAKVRFAGSLDNAICVPLHALREREDGE